MSFLFTRAKPKTPQEVVFALNELVSRSDIADDPKIRDEVYRLLAQARLIALGDHENEPDPDQISALAKQIYATELMSSLVVNLVNLDFDGKKDITSLFQFLLRRQVGAHSPTIEYILAHPSILQGLIDAAGDLETHRSACTILRECAKHEALVDRVLGLPEFWAFFDICLVQPFEVGSDCFLTFSDFLRTHPGVTARFLRSHMPRFMRGINALIMSTNYVTRRQSLRLQSHLMSQRCNNNYRWAYVRDLENLKMVMRLMRDKSKNIHFETFQLFKMFVANPKKPQPIFDVLVRNKQRLLEILVRLNEQDRKEHPLFKIECEFVIKSIENLGTKSPTPVPPLSIVSGPPSSTRSSPPAQHQGGPEYGHPILGPNISSLDPPAF